MTYALITPPTDEPVSLTEAKAFMRLDGSDEDDLVTSLIKTARQYLEIVTGLSMMPQVWRIYRDDWPSTGMISLAHGPVQSVDSVKVYDGDGIPSNFSLDKARLDGTARPARLYLAEIAGARAGLNGIEIDYSAGFGTVSDVPEPAKQAILRHVAHMFTFRGVVGPDQQPAGVPDGYERLIAPLKAWRL